SAFAAGSSSRAGPAAGRTSSSVLARLRDPAVPRAQALHEALLEAEKVLLDAYAFRALRHALSARAGDSKEDGGRHVAGGVDLRRAGGTWQVLRVASSEVALALPADGGRELLQVVVRLGAATPETPSADEAPRLWHWLSQLTTLQLRDLFLQSEGCKGTQTTGSSKELLLAFQTWLQPRLEAAARYLNDHRALDCI
ncbi:unnamed protein product, partial [Polarella glacialis]